VNTKINCTLVGNPQVQGKYVSLTRTNSGQWNCNTDISLAKHRPANCAP
jgi:hypothetical protein